MLEVVEAFSLLLSVGIGSHNAVSRAARAPWRRWSASRPSRRSRRTAGPRIARQRCGRL